MRAVLQRVRKASVNIAGEVVGSIAGGWCVLVGFAQTDTADDCDYMIDKIISLRTFSDSDGKFNLSVEDTGGEILVVSQFTLYGDCRKGRRPSFTEAAKIDDAKRLYEIFLEKIHSQTKLKIAAGVFQADMLVSIENDGPVTMLLDSRKEF